MVTISTEGIRAIERPDYWQATFKSEFGVICRIDPIGEDEFSQSMTIRDFGAAALIEREGSGFAAVRQPNANDVAFAVIPLRGCCRMRWRDGEESLLRLGGVALELPGDAGAATFPEPHRHLIVSFRRQALSEQCPGWERHAGTVLDSGNGAVGLLIELTQSLWSHADSLGPACLQSAGTMLLSLLGSAVATLEEGEAAESSRMRGYHRQRIRNYLIEHLADPELSPAGIAAAIGLSIRYLHNLFADEPLRLMQWVQEQRLCRCQAALASPKCRNLTIAQIAYAWGFNDAAHFSRTFQKRFGVSPRAFRELKMRQPD